jgi:transposase
LKTCTPWEELPIEMGCGSGMTCWRRLHEWHEAGVWQPLWEEILGLFGADELVNWSHVVVDSCSVRTVLGGGDRTESADRGKAGSKRHLLTNANGLPLAIEHTGANVHSSPGVEAQGPYRHQAGHDSQHPTD